MERDLDMHHEPSPFGRDQPSNVAIRKAGFKNEFIDSNHAQAFRSSAKGEVHDVFHGAGGEARRDERRREPKLARSRAGEERVIERGNQGE
jgi:hypothetical protein